MGEKSIRPIGLNEVKKENFKQVALVKALQEKPQKTSKEKLGLLKDNT